MAITYKYNKTSLQELSKAMSVRVMALPTLKSKEGALRLEVKKAREQVREFQDLFEKEIQQLDEMVRLWGEFELDLVRVDKVAFGQQVIAGVKIPTLEHVVFSHKDINLFNQPSWFPDGIRIVEELARLSLQKEITSRKVALLDLARKKTTQKVNLYEKVQIPGYQEAIQKVKRFLEDEENLAKSAQKIMKKRKELAES